MSALRNVVRFFCAPQLFFCLGPSAAAADSPATAPPTVAHTAIFAEIADDTPASVTQRLRGDAALGPLVVAAADAHEERRRTGKVLVITGGVIFGVSDVAGAIVILTTPGYPFVQSQDDARVVLGLAIAVVGIAAGLALVVPGILKLAKHSDEEKRAVEYYAPPASTLPQAPAPIGPPSAPPPPPTTQPIFTMSLPLVSFTF